MIHGCHARVEGQVLVEEQAVLLAILGQIADAVLHSVRRALDRDLLAVDVDVTRGMGVSSEQRACDLGAAGAPAAIDESRPS